MKITTIGACCIAISTLVFMWWRDGRIIASQKFGSILFQIRQVPEGESFSSYVIEVGGTPPISTFRVFEGDSQFKPVKIVQIGPPGEYTFNVQFNNQEIIGVKFRDGSSFAEWFQAK